MNKRDFLKKTGIGALGALAIPSILGANKKIKALKPGGRLRTAHIGVGNMGAEDLRDIASHPQVDVVALCDVDAINLSAARKKYPKARIFADYRVMLADMKDTIDAVVISTPDHTHAPAAAHAMQMNKHVYCQKPLTHFVAESRQLKKLAEEKQLVTQMGIQVHSFYDYKLATLLIQDGIIGKVHTVHAWSPKNWGYKGTEPTGKDDVPAQLDWNLWLGTSPERPYKEGYYHPGNWRKLMDYGCGTLGDMGVHIMDTPYNALQLNVPMTIKNECQKTNGFGYPENNIVTYEFPGTDYTSDTLKWIWYDGPGMPPAHEDLVLPDGNGISHKRRTAIATDISLDAKKAAKGELPEQGAMFVGTKGRLLLPHFMQLPRKIQRGKYVDISKDIAKHNLGQPIRNYDSEGPKHYHEFVDACLGKATCSAPFGYAAKLTETILLGVIAGRFPNQTLHWDANNAKFAEPEANRFLKGAYREF
ncbi:Putative NADH-dependent dehydrogenase [Croceitalea dokdonensis DOKDO 023]|uniref:Putative NADH-dependent dehydrogenase n=1 Tax=Croceitalea dokdonensis DOKDO 023 TaxID=1300341 RepID=A0A0P7AJD5_9FLAO|nr:Gfo/Idh/MocA family oxidoreductase [Croceitalea dokdonensis]KPM31914.1 Putative NADH-dependent dehydrogenase [Croceitalea dokdonensis DOKDO 023]